MDTTAKTIENLLTEAEQLARNEFNHLQIVGRALTVDEVKRSEALSKCLEYIQNALDSLNRE